MLHEVGDGGGQVRLPERGAAGDADQSVRRGVRIGEHAAHVLAELEHAPAADQGQLAGAGQAELAGGPVQQAHAQPAFQLGQVARGHGPGHVHGIGGGGQAAAVHDGHENRHRGHPIHH